jgi:predicted secreted protein
MFRPHLLALMLFALNASAQISQQPFINVITFDASATAEVPTDTLTITLFAEEQGVDPTELATKVNTRIEQALTRARNEPGVDARSGGYHTFPLYDRANQPTGWRIRAEIILESRDFKTVGALAGKLQPALKVSAMVFSLSRSAREGTEAALLSQALQKYQKKASAIANALGFPGFTLSQVAVRTDSPIVQPVQFRAMAAMADGAQPPPVPTEGGKNSVTVTVSGSVVLGPGK